MGSLRFTRLTNAFSKKLANHVAAVSLSAAPETLNASRCATFI